MKVEKVNQPIYQLTLTKEEIIELYHLAYDSYHENKVHKCSWLLTYLEDFRLKNGCNFD